MSDDSDSDEEFDVYVSTRRPTPNPVYAVPCFSNGIASLRELVPPPLQLHLLLVEDNTA